MKHFLESRLNKSSHDCWGDFPIPQPKQAEFIDNPADITLFGGSAGCGKGTRCNSMPMRIAAANEHFRGKNVSKEAMLDYMSAIKIDSEILDKETKVLSWSGRWIHGSELRVGDRIMNPDGTPQKILAIYELGMKQFYRLTFEDGTTVEADEEHLWGCWEARRNSKSKTQKGGNKVFSNLEPRCWNANYFPRARIVTTKELKTYLDKGRRFLIPINAPLRLNSLNRANKEPERAYVYGALLGDGCFTMINKKESRLELCVTEPYIDEKVQKICGLNKKLNYKVRSEQRIPLATLDLRDVEWLKLWKHQNKLSGKYSWEKSFPEGYLTASLDFRYNLVQGLFDTDGHADRGKRKVSYTTTSEILARQVADLVRTLGYMAKISERKPTYTYKDEKKTGRMAYTVHVEGNHLELLFSLPRKRARAENMGLFNNAQSWVGKRIVSIEPTEIDYCRCIRVSGANSLYITDGYNVTHNTFSLLMTLAQKEAIEDPDYRACIFRRSYAEINNPGGIADESKKLYYKLGGVLTKNPYDWVFPSGAKISLRHLQHEKTVHDFQGSQITVIAFDELVHFTENQFTYMLSRNRSMCSYRTRVVATCNPDADSWVAKLIAWWINKETGFPIPERSGKCRAFIRENGKYIWADSKGELLRDHPGCNPLTLSFIGATVFDNEKLLNTNPKYLANLKALHPVERARLLEGNWKERFSAGTIFKKTWFDIIQPEDIPIGDTRKIELVRFWDFAATAKETAKKTSFYTAGVKVLKIRDFYYVLDVIYFQKSAGEVENMVRLIAMQDTRACAVRWELEGGSAAMMFAQTMKNKLVGFDTDAVRPQGDKVTRSYNASSAAHQGKIFLVDADWNTVFTNALDSFDGSPQPLVNDITDAFNGAFHHLSQNAPDKVMETIIKKATKRNLPGKKRPR